MNTLQFWQFGKGDNIIPHGDVNNLPANYIKFEIIFRNFGDSLKVSDFDLQNKFPVPYTYSNHFSLYSLNSANQLHSVESIFYNIQNDPSRYTYYPLVEQRGNDVVMILFSYKNYFDANKNTDISAFNFSVLLNKLSSTHSVRVLTSTGRVFLHSNLTSHSEKKLALSYNNGSNNYQNRIYAEDGNVVKVEEVIGTLIIEKI